MKTIADVLVAVVALEHVWFLVLEMFLWTKPLGLRTFSHTLEEAIKMAPLAAKQGLYNGFLAAGLVWGLMATPPEFAYSLKVFFLACVVVAGFFGGFTVSLRILLIQAVPAALALVLLFLSSR